MKLAKTLAWQETPATGQNTGEQETTTRQRQKEKHNAGAKGEGHKQQTPNQTGHPDRTQKRRSGRDQGLGPREPPTTPTTSPGDIRGEQSPR